MRRSDNFVFSSSSSSSSSSTGNDGKVYFTQQSSHHSNAGPSFANRFGGDDGGFQAFGANGGFAGTGAGAGSGSFVFDYPGGNYASTSGSHYNGAGSGGQYSSQSSGAGIHHSASPASGSYNGNRKPTGQTVITSGVIENGKVHSKTDKINHYD